MIISRVLLKNWRNFRSVDVPLREQVYLVGPNASGKSNFLDVFRFLSDVVGRGFGFAVQEKRGGIKNIRCLHARKDPEVCIEVHLAEGPDDKPKWKYILAFRNEGKGANRVLISREEVWAGEKCKLKRPNEKDNTDTERLTQTHLEQKLANEEFREIAEYFRDTVYLHLVPQLLKYGDKIGGQRVDGDPFGQGFLERIAKTTERTRASRLRRIQEALKTAVPQFEELAFDKDVMGHPHLKAKYTHWRHFGGWQEEDQFSDGTLRLLALLWLLTEGDSLLLLEEPELSLNNAIVEQIPLMLQRIQRNNKRSRQVIVSTHSEALLSNKGIDGRGVLRLVVGEQGSDIQPPNKQEIEALKRNFSIAEVILPKTRPPSTEQMSMNF